MKHVRDLRQSFLYFSKTKFKRQLFVSYTYLPTANWLIVVDDKVNNVHPWRYCGVLRFHLAPRLNSSLALKEGKQREDAGKHG